MSAELAMHKALDYVYDSLDDKKYVLCLLLGLLKSFDVVDHRILLGKLFCYDDRNSFLQWFRSYLSRREQCTQVESFELSDLTVGAGVSQGSIMGPLLFMIFTNDIIKTKKLLKLTLYPDDTTVLYASQDQDNLVDTFNSELAKLDLWCSHNHLILNANKSKYMLSRRNPGLIV